MVQSIGLVFFATTSLYQYCFLFFQFSPRKSACDEPAHSPYSLSPVSAKSQKLLRSPRKAARKISKIPFKVITH